MDFELTLEQRMVQESTRKCMKQIEPLLSKFDQREQTSKELCLQILKHIVPLGAIGNIIPEEAGGGGMDCLTWGLMYEQLDKKIDNMINLMSVVASEIYQHGSNEQKEKYLTGLLNAEIIGSYAITESNVGSNPSGIETKAVLDGDSYIINGTKLFITNGQIADIAIVLASTDKSKGNKGISRFIVDKRESPFLSRPIETIAGKSVVAELVFENCRIPKKNLLGKEGEALSTTFKTLQLGRSIVGLHATKLAQEAIDHSIRYVQERQQFGKPIGSFQLIQSMIAEMMAETDASRLLSYRALSLLDKNDKNSTVACSMAKFYASEAAVRARINTIPDGTTQIQQLIIGREVLGFNALK